MTAQPYWDLLIQKHYLEWLMIVCLFDWLGLVEGFAFPVSCLSFGLSWRGDPRFSYSYLDYPGGRPFNSRSIGLENNFG